MSCRRVIVRDKILFRILKTRGKDVSEICEKMESDLRNITVLSEDELCELWHHVKIILLDAQKLSLLQSDNEHSKEQQQALKLIHAITAMASETLLQRTFVPNTLLEIVIILHSVILSEIKGAKLRDEISYLLENWWDSDMIWKEKVIINAIKYLIEQAKTSLSHIIRLHAIRSALYLIKRNEDVQNLVELSRNTIVMSIQEGKDFLLHLFTFGEEFIMGIHDNVKAALEIADANVIKVYADLYAKAYANASSKNKTLLSTKCFKDIIFHCLRSPRNSMGRVKLGKNLLIFLNALHRSDDNAVKKVLYEHCEALLWKHLKARGSCVRCNAAEILLIVYPAQSRYLTKKKSDMNLNNQHAAISRLLKDSDQEVCLIAVNGTLKILETHWDRIPADTIKDWLNTLSSYMRSKCSSEIKINILNGIKQVISNERSHANFKNFLHKFANRIIDEDIEVIKSLTKLLVHLQNHVGISVWDIVTLSSLLKCIEDSDEVKVLKQLVKLLYLYIRPNDFKNGNATQEIVNMGTKNIVATRKFFFHSKHVINWDNALRLINAILGTIDKQAKCLLDADETSDEYCKRFKRDDDKSKNGNSVRAINEDVGYTCESIGILLDVIAILLYVNKKNFTKEYFVKGKKDLQHVFTSVLPKFLCPHGIQKIGFNESTIFLLSFVPVELINNSTNICETIMKQLCDPNISDDTLITILHTLTKWGKIDMVLASLKESMAKCTNQNQESSDRLDTNEQQKLFTQSVRTFKHLLDINSDEELSKTYHEDLVKIWKDLSVVQNHIENKFEDKSAINDTTKEEVLKNIFKEYISIACVLLNRDICNISERYQEILLWIEKKVLPKISDIEKQSTKHRFPIDILKITFNACNLMITRGELSPNLCCKVIVLYFKTISTSDSVVFIDDALSAIIALLDFSKACYDNEDTNLLNIILPKFLSAVMLTVIKHSKDSITVHTNNFKLLSTLIRKYFETIERAYDDQKMHTAYLSVILNAAVNGISKEINNFPEDSSTDDILKIEFPYLTERILKFTLHVKEYQDACFLAIKQAVTQYDEVDILSTLLIIHKMFKSPIKLVKLRELARTIKLEHEGRSNFITSNGSINDAIKAVISLIDDNS